MFSIHRAGSCWLIQTVHSTPIYKLWMRQRERPAGTTCSDMHPQATPPELAIYAPMIYTPQKVIFLMPADPLRGQVGGGWALEIETWALKWQRAKGRVPFGPKKVEISRAQLPPTCPSYGFARKGPYKS